MNGLKRRIDKLEKAARAGKEKPIRLIFQSDGEPQEAALKKAGITELDDNDINIFIFKWSDGKAHQYPTHQEPAAVDPQSAAAIDAEINRLTRELEQEGYSRQKIVEMLADQEYPK